MKFERNYFDTLYQDDTIDGIFNAHEHANYLKSTFQMMGFDVSSIIDFGIGKGKILNELIKTFKPKRVEGLDISKFAVTNYKSTNRHKRLKLQCCSIINYRPKKRPYDLAICNSVIQYLPDNEVSKAFSILASSAKFTYLQIPTSSDYKKMKREFNHFDPWAHQRTTEFYLRHINRHFTRVGWGLVESKKFNNYQTSPFYDSIYRI